MSNGYLWKRFLRSCLSILIIMLIVFALIWAHPISRVCSELSALIPGEGGIYAWGKEPVNGVFGLLIKSDEILTFVV